MTHLYGNTLVFKNHPRIAFRGNIDALEGEIIWCQKICMAEHETPVAVQLDSILDFVRSLIRADVMGTAVEPFHLLGFTESQVREQSHNPLKYFGQGHFMPSRTDCAVVIALNKVRTLVRQTELSAYDAFQDENGCPTRIDIITALNRLSSLFWILEIQSKTRSDSLG